MRRPELQKRNGSAFGGRWSEGAARLLLREERRLLGEDYTYHFLVLRPAEVDVLAFCKAPRTAFCSLPMAGSAEGSVAH